MASEAKSHFCDENCLMIDEDELTQADVIFMYGYNPAAQWGAIKTGYPRKRLVIS